MDDLVLALNFIFFSARSVVEDIRTFRVRRKELLVGIIVSAGEQIIISPGRIAHALAATVIAAAFFILIGAVLKGKLGLGDAWLSAFVGISFGFWNWNSTIVIASVLGISWILILRVSGRRPSLRDIRIPFVPFMFVGALAVAVYRGLSS